MTDLFLSGRDALALLSRHGVNTFRNFGPGRAKQYVAVSEAGYFIGDAILFHLDDGQYGLVGHPTVASRRPCRFRGTDGFLRQLSKRHGRDLKRH